MSSCLLSSGCRTGQSEHLLFDAATPMWYDNIHQSLHRNGCTHTHHECCILAGWWELWHHQSAVTCLSIVWATRLQNLVYNSYNVSLAVFVLQNYQDCWRLTVGPGCLGWGSACADADRVRWQRLADGQSGGFKPAAAWIQKAELHRVFWERNRQQKAAGNPRCYRFRSWCWRAQCLFYLNDHSTLQKKPSADRVTFLVFYIACVIMVY